MATAKSNLLLLILICIISSFLPSSISSNPTPTPWPTQFHSLLYINRSGPLQITDLYYDWPNGRNFNIIQHQLGNILYDLEWTNGTSFYYTLDSTKQCKTMHFDVGILRPDWLDGADYLGQEYMDGFLCNVWTKVDFIWYYEDVVTKRPVNWLFYTGMSTHVMTFEVGVVLEDSKWQAPVYCFEKGEEENNPKPKSVIANATLETLMQKKSALRCFKRLYGFLNTTRLCNNYIVCSSIPLFLLCKPLRLK